MHSIETLFTASIIVDTIIGYLLLFNKNGGKSVRQWYKELTIGAYVMDITSIIIGTYLATLLSSDFYMQLFYVVIIGLIHDISFFTFLINVNTKSSKVLEICKNYGITPSNTMFVGNDVNDIPAIKIVKFPVGVGDSYPEIFPYILFKTQKPGGYGAVREICDLVFNSFSLE
jgi:hypothetical protein